MTTYIGTALSRTDLHELATRKITALLVRQAGLQKLDAVAAAELLHKPVQEDGLIIPHRWPGENEISSYRIYFYKQAIYCTPPSARHLLYFPPAITFEELQDPTLPLLLVEDELAALSLCRTRRRRRAKVFLPAAWCGNHFKDLDRLQLDRRSVFLLLDRDRDDRELVGELQRRRAHVARFVWPQGITTVPDLLARLKPTAIRNALERAAGKAGTPVLSHPTPARPVLAPATIQLLLKRFVAACCARSGTARGGALYAAYLKWAQAHAVKLTRNEFGLGLARLFAKSRDRRGVRYHGICLPEANEDRAPFLPGLEDYCQDPGIQSKIY
jgi:hypothetical protein